MGRGQAIQTHLREQAVAHAQNAAAWINHVQNPDAIQYFVRHAELAKDMLDRSQNIFDVEIAITRVNHSSFTILILGSLAFPKREFTAPHPQGEQLQCLLNKIGVTSIDECIGRRVDAVVKYTPPPAKTYYTIYPDEGSVVVIDWCL